MSLTKIISTVFLFIIGIWFLSTTQVVASMNHKNRTCFSGLEDQGKSVKELVEKASIISYMEAVSFEEDDSVAPFDGYYQLGVRWELKPNAVMGFRVLGLRPHKNFPQYFFDLTQRHELINVNKVTGGFTGTVIIDGKCTLAPRFVLGYNYLVFVGIESRMAFEPVHSPDLDKWALAVKEAAMEDHRKRTGQ